MEWGIEAGQFFKAWRESKHVIEPFTIPNEWMRFRSMDWGSARPYACLWWAVDYDGNLYAYRELYGWGGKPNVGTGETAAEVGRRIAELETKQERLDYGVLDSACWAKTGVTGPTIAEELNNELYKKGLVTFGKCSKGRVEGANAFKQRLIGNQQKDGSYKPAIFFFNTCIHAIRTIPMLAHDKHNPETYDTDGEDHACFVAGTLITTLRGDIPIEEVTTSDYVLTRGGYRRVLASGVTKRNAEVVTANFSNGRALIATKNHPVFVRGKGFIPLVTVSYGDMMCSIGRDEKCLENKQRRQIALYSMGLRSGAIQIQKMNQIEDTIEQMEGLGSRGSAISIMRSGSFIMGQSRKGITSTTRMRTLSTMTSRIWSYFQVKNICLSTCKNIMLILSIVNALSKILNQSKKKLRNGTGRKKDENGIESMQRKLLQKRLKSQWSKKLALCVGKSSSRHLTGGMSHGSAPEHAIRSIDATMESTMKQEFASSAGNHSGATGSHTQEHAGENAVQFLWLSTETRRADVYNLTVDGVHEYFANGFLVHNCDSIAYACMSRPWQPTKPEAQKPRDKYAHKEAPSAWAI